MRIDFNLDTERSDYGHYMGVLQIASPQKIYSQAAKSLAMGADSIGGAWIECRGVRGGQLADLEFKKAEVLDHICAGWLIERGLISIGDLPDDLQGVLRQS